MQPAQKKSLSARDVVIWTSVVLALVMGCNALVSRQSAGSQTQALVQVGNTGHLQNPSGGSVALADSADDMESVVRAFTVRDSVGLDQLRVGGRLVQSPNGTAVRVIDGDARLGLGLSQVRVLDGPYAGQAWWALDSSLSP